jgi:hypothetical protein
VIDILHAFHALALDEHRGAYSPTLWHFPADGKRRVQAPKDKTPEDIQIDWFRASQDKNATEETLNAAWKAMIDCSMYEQLKGLKSKLLQVWFPGVHINIGGGSNNLLEEGHKGDLEREYDIKPQARGYNFEGYSLTVILEIALITFGWMCEQVAPFLQFNEDLSSLAASTIQDRLNLMGSVMASVEKSEKDGEDNSSWISKKVWDLLGTAGAKKAQLSDAAHDIVHGWATGPIIDGAVGFVTATGNTPRTPGDYLVDKSKKEAGVSVKLGPTKEMIHPSIQYRKTTVTNPSYEPPALKGFTRSDQPVEAKQNPGEPKKTTKKWRYEWRKGDIVIPEYTIRAEDAFSRYIAKPNGVSEDSALAFIEKIDKAIAAKNLK